MEIDGEEWELEFLTNNMEWSPQGVADLYRNGRSFEVFFKQIKQTLNLAGFSGYSANACAGKSGARPYRDGCE